MAKPELGSSAFYNITFFKSGKDIAEKAKTVVSYLQAKIEERNGRILKIKKETGLNDVDWTAALMASAQRHNHGLSIANNVRTLGDDNGGPTITVGLTSGQAYNVREELNHIEREKKEITTLEILARNINVNDSHKLTFAELEYLGF